MARLPPGDRRRQLADRRDGQDRRPLLLLQGDPEGPPRAAGVVPAGRRSSVGWTNIVPVDYVAAAIDHIAHQDGPRRPGLPPRRPQGAARRRRAEHVRRAPATRRRRSMRDRQAHDATCCPKGVLSLRDEAAGAQGRSARTSSPTSASRTRSSSTSRSPPRSTRATPSARSRARASSSRRSRPTPTKLWDYWERNLDPDLFKDRSFEGAVNGKTVVITGASSGIGRAAALKIAAAGGIPILVARTQDKLEEVKAEIEARGRHRLRRTRATSPTTTRSTRSSRRCFADHAVDRHARQQRGPLDPALGRALLRPLPRLRAHGPAQLPRHDQADPRRCCRTCATQGGGHIVNVSSIGVQTNPPRFCAYVGLQGGARRVHARGELARRSATTSPSRRSTCRSCARR